MTKKNAKNHGSLVPNPAGLTTEDTESTEGEFFAIPCTRRIRTYDCWTLSADLGAVGGGVLEGLEVGGVGEADFENPAGTKGIGVEE